jgi:hypothetical protein
MSSRWRRFEVLLPLRFNDGRDVPPDWLADAVLEVVDHFSAASYETQKVEGHWRHSGVIYRDDLARIVVDVPDSAANRLHRGRDLLEPRAIGDFFGERCEHGLAFLADRGRQQHPVRFQPSKLARRQIRHDHDLFAY